MTYAGIGAMLFRFIGLVLIANVLLGFLAAGSAVFGPAGLTLSIFLILAFALIVGSKLLGRVLAAGLE